MPERWPIENWAVISVVEQSAWKTSSMTFMHSMVLLMSDMARRLRNMESMLRRASIAAMSSMRVSICYALVLRGACGAIAFATASLVRMPRMDFWTDALCV